MGDALARLHDRPVGFWGGQLDVLPWSRSRQLAQGVDALGYASIWIPESVGREALSHSALLLESTTSAVVATGIANIWVRDAVAMRNGARTLSEAHPGRFVLGLGVSHEPLVRRRGGEYDRPLHAMANYLDAFEVATTRAPEPAEEDMLLAALGPRMLALARDRSGGAHSFCVPVEHTRQARSILGTSSLVVAQSAVIGVPAAEAREVARDHLGRYLSLPNYRNNLARLGWSAEAMDPPVDDEVIDALVTTAGAEAAAARVAEHLDAGASHVALQIVQAEPDADAALEALEQVRELLRRRGRWSW